MPLLDHFDTQTYYPVSSTGLQEGGKYKKPPGLAGGFSGRRGLPGNTYAVAGGISPQIC
ncbi:hypothetical protein Ethha_2387 [Ethanoligenens harbinense YUAN-3]|uniref:Uncharacterized protein n=1 Tax=Ethanoligenens harbinense (strain DSM 18485 / JCM 12961 / CGMCC 1.5033 / YUAN-3) TaxID=663278 RepID=E6U573_ETHHY|nr:hypothetical protein Ethha_2387 [Ethanoligenens harbinense YUAN-3]